MQGILVINKPSGFTSMDCCAIVRKAFGEKKVGHTGTLDPNATGVLPICIGKATRLIEYMDTQSKTYIADFRLGFVSDTEDVWGSVTKISESIILEKTVREALNSFKGDIKQVPPMYSAKKINGRKLYDIARLGQEVERKAVKIHIDKCDLLSYWENEGRLEITCSRGTYIRTIIADLGKTLGCGAIMTSLVRTSTSGFSLDDAVDFMEIKRTADANEKCDLKLIPLERGICLYPRFDISDKGAKLLLNGNPEYIKYIPKECFSKDILTVFYNSKLIAILKNNKIDKVFNENI